jgi:hypothetical protein
MDLKETQQHLEEFYKEFESLKKEDLMNVLDQLSIDRNAFTDFMEKQKNLNLVKNERYGNAAMSPVKIFNQSDASNSILVRLDDKMNRIIISGGVLRKNDICDLIGYLALYAVSQGWDDLSDLED